MEVLEAQAISKIEAATTTKDIKYAVAEMLGVFDPEPLVEASQSVIDFEDDTDLVAAA